MMMFILSRYLTIMLVIGLVSYTGAQTGPLPEKIEVDGQVVTAIITEDDTLFIADLGDVSITSKRKFADKNEYALYLRYRRYANKVYPYAVKAIRIFREVEEVTQNMKRRQQRKHIRRLQRELNDEFEEPLKSLSKTQGKILVHMIENELCTPLFYLIKDLKGGLKANYWNAAGKLYGYHLRKGYVIGEDPVMDLVLDDFNITHPD